MKEDVSPESPRRRLANTPIPSEHLPQRGNAFSRWLGSSLLAMFGWRFEGNLPQRSKLVAIGAPHTSAYDVYLAIFAFWALGLRVSWMAKHTLFRGLGAWFFPWMDAVPINRTAAHGVVEQIAAVVRQREKIIIAIAPEGTRAKVDRWKTGFYHIAEKASVPILPVGLDFSRKVISLGNCFWTTGEMEADLEFLKGLYSTEMARNPAQY